MAQPADQISRMLRHSPVMLWHATAEGRLDFLSDEWARFLGRELPDDVELVWNEAIHPDDRARVTTLHRDGCVHGAAFATDFRLRRFDGLYRLVRWRANPVHDGAVTVAYVGTCTDLEDSHVVDELRAAAAEQMKEAIALRDDFLARVSHQLRTPLHAVLGWARIMRTGGLPLDEFEKALSVIERNAASQARLVDDLLDSSRVTYGLMRIEVGAVDVAQLVDAVSESFAPALLSKRLTLQSVIDRDAGPVSGDPHRLQQVITNLLSNAIKFTPKGGRIQIALERTDSNVVLVVSDNGTGFPSHLSQEIFERFSRASTVDHETRGLGLGLAIARHIVELHGGSIAASSDGVGTGASFSVTLPVSLAREQARKAIVTPPPDPVPAHDCPPNLEGLLVLVVDDDADARELVSTIVARCAANALTASSSADALKLLDRAKPDLIVCDLGMPHEDGFAFIKQLRARSREEGGKIPAAALTAHATAEHRTRSLRAGFQMHLSKPVHPDELLAALAVLADIAGSLRVGGST